jgi:nucleoside-diphosphate-sugar epimerase
VDVLITGGNGFLGRHLISSLQERGDRVRVLVLPAEDTGWLEQHEVTVFRGDILDPGTLTAPMRGAEGLFHLAAMLGAWGALQTYSDVNVVGTANVCRAALDAGVSRVVHISSAMVYDLASPAPAAEDDLLAPLDEPYSLTKAQGDMVVQRLIREERLPAVILRPGTLIGPGDRLNFGRMADRVGAGQGVIIGRGNNAIPLFSIADMVQGLLLALDAEQAAGKIYNIGTDQPLTQAGYLSLIAQELGAPAPRRRVPYRALFAAAHMAERLAEVSNGRIPPFLTRHGVKLYGADNLMSIDKARRELGYVPQVPVAEAVRMACAWYRHPDAPPAPSRVEEMSTTW